MARRRPFPWVQAGSPKHTTGSAAKARAGAPVDVDAPDLNELMADPITRAVMVSDGITADQLWRTIRDAQARL